MPQNSAQTLTNKKKSNCDKIQRLKLWQKSETQILLRTTWHPNKLWDVFEAVTCDLVMFK